MTVTFTPDRNLYPFESRWFESSAGRVHYVDEGSRDAPAIVLFHGNPTWSFLYREIVTGLRGRFRVIAPDYLGFGLSDRPAGFGYTPQEHISVMGELVDALGLDRFAFMGQDWGGPVSLGVAVERPERVTGVVLGSTGSWVLPEHRLFSRVMSTGWVQRQILEQNLFVRRVLPLGMTRKLSHDELRHYLEVQPTPQDRRGIAEFPKQIRAARGLLSKLEEEVPRVLGGKPALLLWGTRDLVWIRRRHLPRLQRVFTDHRVVVLPKANHYIQEDAPAAIVAAILDRFT